MPYRIRYCLNDEFPMGHCLRFSTSMVYYTMEVKNTIEVENQRQHFVSHYGTSNQRFNYDLCSIKNLDRTALIKNEEQCYFFTFRTFLKTEFTSSHLKTP